MGRGLGFRDLAVFNFSLLSKQGWRILQNPEFVLAKCLKAKYYPSSDFLKTPLCQRPSYAWRSIWEAIDLLEKGFQWRVGDGQSIRVWKDVWLHEPCDFNVTLRKYFF